MAHYRDYGYLTGSSVSPVEIDTEHNTQVYIATHDGAGNYLPYRNRSFISFSFGGKNIEDFDLIATIDNDFLERRLYADFEDNVSDSEIWDGQIYWSSHYTANEIDFSLATDGITDKQLSAFKTWFKPGRIEELILAENPNRAILARVAEAPTYHFMPFEHPIEVMVAGTAHKTSTTLYRGTIDLHFIMDDPFWYAKINILDHQIETSGEYKTSYWIDANGQESLILEDKDAIKVIHEDNVPINSMLPNESSASRVLFGTEIAVFPDLSGGQTSSYVGEAQADFGHVAFRLMSDENGMALPATSLDNPTAASCGYFYYGGNAPAKPILMFEFVPTFDSNGFISAPANSFTSSENTYNTIVLESVNKQEFQFTTPALLMGYNQVINIFKTIPETSSWEDVYEALRDTVKHAAARNYGRHVVDLNKIGTQVSAAALEAMVTNMQDFLTDPDIDTVKPIKIIIDSKTGIAKGQFYYRDTNEQLMISEEDVGDMIRSKYLIIEDTNYPTDDGYVVNWTVANPTASHRIYSDLALTKVNLQYKYLYL